LVETFTRSGVAGFLQFPSLMSDYQAYLQGGHPNYFMAGYQVGTMFKYVMDLNVNN